MSPTDSELWYSIQLDPGTASFFGLPETVEVPAGEGAFLGGDPNQADMDEFSQVLERVVAERPEEADPAVFRFLARWPRYRDMERYRRVDNLTFAEQIALELVRDDPGDPPALFVLGHLAAQDEDWERAAERFDGVLERAPDHTMSRLCSALAQAGAGQREEAAAILKALGQRTSIMTYARFWHYEVTAGSWPSFSAKLKETFRLLSQPRTDLKELLAELQAISADNPEVLCMQVYVESPSPDPETSERLLRRAVELSPGHVVAVASLAERLSNDGKEDEALQFLERGLREHPHEDQLLGIQGTILFAQERYDEALASFRAVFEQPLALVHPATLMNAGRGLILLGHTDEAGMVLSDAQEARPGDPLPFSLRAELKEKVEGKAAAEAVLREGLEECGLIPILQGQLGDLLRRGGRTEEAREIARELIERFPDSPLGHQAMGDLHLGQDPAQAVEHYERALNLNPTLLPAGMFYLQGVTALRQGNADEARRLLERAVASERDNWRFVSALGTTWFHLGKLEPALACAEKALALCPGNPGLMHNLAAGHRVRFRRNPLRYARSAWTAWRLSRDARRSRDEDWQRDLWNLAPENDPKEAPPPASS